MTEPLVTKEPESIKAQALAEDWSEVDAEWLEKHVAPPFQAIALRHGRMCFSMVMQCGMLSASLGQIAGQLQAMGGGVGRVVSQALQVAQRISQDFSVRILTDAGVSQEAFFACRQDVEQMGALSMESPAPGRIVLPN